MEIGDWLLAMFTPNEAIDKLHWPRTIQGDHRDNILECASFEVAQITFHTGRFKLEHTSSFGSLEKLISLLIIKR